MRMHTLLTRAAAGLLVGVLALTGGCSEAQINGAIEKAKSYVDSSQTTDDNPATGTAPADGTWDENTAPNYYLVTGKADFTAAGTMPAAGQVRIGDPDSLNRPTGAYATVTYQLMQSGSDRDRDMPDTITGWPEHNPKAEITFASGRVYHGYLFNKSHLLAKSLGGPDEPDNMITGTRPQNVGDNDKTPGGMAYTETEAREWLKANPSGTIQYMAVPKYVGDELVPRTVDVDIKSSDGSIDEHVVTFNAAKGYDIDYQNGGVK